MDPHFLTITTTKTREMSFNDSGGMVYLKDAFDEDGVIQNPTYHRNEADWKRVSLRR